tara:strand:+ start:4386 stop:5021 length:636 start_codon:yes stop_codon:yes gene_type:complete
MHTSNKINILSIAESDFNNSLKELKEHLNFNLSFIKINEINELSNKYDVLLIHESILKDENTKKSLNKISSNKILISKSKDFKNFKFDERLNIPININELNKKAVELSARKEFSSNSSIEIKDYILDKNEKKLKKNNSFIIVTEKEIQLLELLFKKKDFLKKKIILETVWKYASDADTHTVETHIYRLRKKIIDEFNDKNFIINSKEGYKI